MGAPGGLASGFSFKGSFEVRGKSCYGSPRHEFQPEITSRRLYVVKAMVSTYLSSEACSS